MAITNWSDPIDSASWNTSLQFSILFGVVILLDFFKEYDEVMKNKPKIVLIKIFCFFLATCRNVVAAYVTNLWVFAGGDKAAYIAHRVLVMLTWFMTFFLLYYRLALTFLRVDHKLVIGARIILGLLLLVSLAECFGCLGMGYTECWNVFEPAMSLGVLLSTIYFDMVYMVRLFYLLNKVKKQDNISVFKYLFLPLQTMLVSIIYCIASWKFFLNANTEYSELSFFNNTWWDIAWSVLPFIVIKSSTSSDIKKLAAYTKASSQSKVSTNDNYKTTSTEKI